MSDRLLVKNLHLRLDLQQAMDVVAGLECFMEELDPSQEPSQQQDYLEVSATRDEILMQLRQQGVEDKES